MKNDYEQATLIAIGAAQEVILGLKSDILLRESDLDPFLTIWDDDE